MQREPPEDSGKGGGDWMKDRWRKGERGKGSDKVRQSEREGIRQRWMQRGHRGEEML